MWLWLTAERQLEQTHAAAQLSRALCCCSKMCVNSSLDMLGQSACGSMLAACINMQALDWSSMSSMLSVMQAGQHDNTITLTKSHRHLHRCVNLWSVQF